MKPISIHIQEILGVSYVAPHSSPDGVSFKEPRCGDCFCIIQQVHTHEKRAEEEARKILEAIKSRDSYVLGEEEKPDHYGIFKPDGSVEEVDMNPANRKRSDIAERMKKSL